MPDSYICSICGQTHEGAPLSWGPGGPDMLAALPPAERQQRGELGTDQAVIDEQHYFIRGRIEIPIIDTGDLFAWLAWVQISADDFFHISDLWTVEGRETKAPPYNGRLANELGAYSNRTLDLQVKLHTRSVGERPFIDIVGDHPLRDEQRRGIPFHPVQEIGDKLLNQSSLKSP